MAEPTIICPKCKGEIRLTESLAAPLVEATRVQFQQQLAQKDVEVTRREQALEKARQAVELSKQGIEQEVAERLARERQAIVIEEAGRAKRAVELDLQNKDTQLAESQRLLADREARLKKAQVAEADMLKKTRELEDAKRELEISVQKGINAGLQLERDKAKREAEEGSALKIREKEEQIAGMQRQIVELQRRAEQGSQQLQGEVQELMLEEELRVRFPFDVIDPVGKGELGGDIVQRVIGAGGRVCGTILWETKRTKTWNDGWLSKLREDQRRAKADLAILVSHTLPKDLETFDFVDGIYVTGPKCVMPVAMALRESLLLMSSVRSAGEGQQTKMALMYDYLTGPEFKHRISAIVDRFVEMQADLATEKRAMMRLWAKREKQIDSVLDSTAGFYGDLQGIAGKAMFDIEAFELPKLTAPHPEEG